MAHPHSFLLENIFILLEPSLVPSEHFMQFYTATMSSLTHHSTIQRCLYWWNCCCETNLLFVDSSYFRQSFDVSLIRPFWACVSFWHLKLALTINLPYLNIVKRLSNALIFVYQWHRYHISDLCIVTVDKANSRIINHGRWCQVCRNKRSQSELFFYQ